MELCHITSLPTAEEIVKRGFSLAEISSEEFDPNTKKVKKLKGVFFSDLVIPADESVVMGQSSIFIIDFPEELIKPYEIDGSEYELEGKVIKISSWCLPANLVNEYFKDKKFFFDDDPDADFIFRGQ